MKKNKYIFFCTGLLLCGSTAIAASLESSSGDIQENFQRLVATKQCPRCDLRGTVLTRMDLRGADLQGADLSDAKLSLTNLSKANLQHANLRGAVLGGADFAGADLRGADLTDAKLAGAYFKEAILDQEIVPENSYESKELPDALPSEMSDEDAGSELSDTPISTSTPTGPPDVSVHDSLSSEQEEQVTSSDVVSAQEEGGNISPAIGGVENVDNREGSENTGELEIEPEEAQVNQVPQLSPDTMQEVEKKKVDLPDIAGRTATTLRPKELVPMVDAEVAEPVIEEPQAEMKQAEQNIAALNEVPVIDTAHEETEGKVKAEEKERGLWDSFTSLFTSSEGEEEKTEKADVPSVKTITADIQAEKSEQGVDAEKNSVTPALSPQAEVQGPSREEGQQAAAAYTVETFAQGRARLQPMIEKLHEKKRCVACDLAGADLRGEDLEEVDLERADLSGAQLEGTDLRSANLKGVNFTDANLKNADLRQADLYLADFTNANLTGTQLEGALIDSADFSGSVGAKLKDPQE